ncbi:MAG: tail fiber protein [Bryobacteraceae bacterium]
MSEPFLGQLALVGFNFPPYKWAFCQGQLMSIAQNTALFSLLGTTYGGDGRVTFGLPDLRGRIPIGNGQGPGLTDRQLGDLGGDESHTLTLLETPGHGHPVPVNAGRPEGLTTPVNNYLGNPQAGTPYAPGNSPLNQHLAPAMSLATGGSQPHENRAPVIGLNWVIALSGVFPSRG